jgi:methionine sulfoxide reductase catalytic subunit
MQAFDQAHQAIHYPPDRRFRVWIDHRFVLAFAVVVLTPVAIAWVQCLSAGLPTETFLTTINLANPPSPHGFPAWLRLTHFVNFFFLLLLVRSGLSILMDHPRLYWNRHCTPNTEWMRFTPLKVPTDRLWTAKDDARYISPLVALPGYRHTVGMARAWHFLSVYGFLLNGFIFIALLFFTDQWRRLVPVSWGIIPAGWKSFVYYATFHLPAEPNGFYQFNPLQQLSYFAVIFVMAPLSMLTGIAMSPAVDNRFPFFPRIFGSRQGARSIHFILVMGYLCFLAVHVGLVAMTGFVRNMNHIVTGLDDSHLIGMVAGLIAIGLVILSWVLFHFIAWKSPRAMQHGYKVFAWLFHSNALSRLQPDERYTQKDISPFFWPNGKLPVSDKWKQLAANGFRDFKLKVGGLVENPIELSLADLRELGKTDYISMHHCIQGWSGIAQWGGLPFKRLIEIVKPRPEAKVVAFYSYGGALYGGEYYDTQTIETALKARCLLAYEMNHASLPEVYGAPLRLRVENQLGYKMVKWIERIEFVETEKTLGKGEGGKNEDDEYFDILPNI